MKPILALVVVLFGTCWGSPSGRVIGGDAVYANRYPYLVSIQSMVQNHQHQCGGAIISPSWVITAAHCAGVSLIVSNVVAGIYNLTDVDTNPNAQIRSIDLYNVIKHPDYNEISNDIALLKMKEPFEFNEFVQPLPISKVPCVATDEPTTFSGWGTNDGSEDFVAMLRTGNMTVVPFQECYNLIYSVYGDNVPLNDDIHICVTGSAAPCLLDGGSPLVQDGRLVGLLSWLHATCLNDKIPAIFTKTGYFKQFIKKYVDDMNW